MNDDTKHIRDLVAEAETKMAAVNYYDGICPHCYEAGDIVDPPYVNVGRDHYRYCTKHGVFWEVGSNLYSGWQHESEETWRRNAQMLENMRPIKPLFTGMEPSC